VNTLDQLKEYLNAFISLLNRPLLSFGEVSFSIGQALLVTGVVLLLMTLARWLEKFFTRHMTRREMDPNLILLARRSYYVVVIALLTFTALSMLNVPLHAFAFVSGAVAIGVGFGAQNVINNFISGWILMGEQPIRIGDLLEVGDTLGRVESIKTRSTLVRRLDGVHIVIPNSHLLENTVINWTLVDQEIRTMVAVGVAYGSPVRKVAALIEQAVREQPEALTEPEPVVLFQEFGDNALQFETYFWTLLRPGGDLRKLRSEVRFRITELFDEAGIVIAFPQRDVHLDGVLRLTGDSNPAAAEAGVKATSAEQKAPTG
jgi:small-conductance mechanosensitive channel